MSSASAFEEQVDASLAGASRRPPRTLVIRPDEWAYDWSERPKTAVVFGIRLPSGQDTENAQLAARRVSTDERSTRYIQTLGCFLAARAICSPNDFGLPHPTLEMPEDSVPAALTMACVERILGEVAVLHTEQSPVELEATDADIEQLAELLRSEVRFDEVDPARVKLARRHLLAALELLE